MAFAYLDPAVADIVEVFFFEQWLRHYYVVEKDGGLALELPADDLVAVYQKHEHLGSLADMMNNKPISPESCQECVGTYIGARYDGSKYGPGVVTRALDSKAFKIEMYVIGVWLKGHEGYLDQRTHSFDEWLEMYANWREMPQVKEYLQKLNASGDPNQPASASVH